MRTQLIAQNLKATTNQLTSWYVLRTRSRQEKALATTLDARGIHTYLPLVRKVRYYGTRKVAVDMPLFPCYLFLRGTLEQAYEADRTRRVAQIIDVVDQQRIDWELMNIHLALSRRAPLFPEDYLANGARVEVRSGPFRGLQGWVRRRQRRNRLVLQVETFGGAASLEVDESLLDPID